MSENAIHEHMFRLICDINKCIEVILHLVIRFSPFRYQFLHEFLMVVQMLCINTNCLL